MSAQAWFIIAIVGFSLAGVALIIAVFMFIKMNIPAIIGDLSGKTVAREIKAMREANILSGDKSFRPSSVNQERGKLTEKVNVPKLNKNIMGIVHASKRLDKPSEQLRRNAPSGRGGTVSFSDAVSEIPTSKATTVLSNKTTALNVTTALHITRKLDVEKETVPITFKETKSIIVQDTDVLI